MSVRTTTYLSYKFQQTQDILFGENTNEMKIHYSTTCVLLFIQFKQNLK